MTAEEVATIMRRIKPGCCVEVIDQTAIEVGGRRVNLNNLYRMIATMALPPDQVAERFVQTFLCWRDHIAPLTWATVRTKVFPRLQPESFLAKQQIVQRPFVNGTCVTFVRDLPEAMVPLTHDQLSGWGVDIEDCERVAISNMRRLCDRDMQIVGSREGGVAAVVTATDSYSASRLLLPDIGAMLAPILGRRFYIGTPCRDRFVAFTSTPPEFVERMRKIIADEYARRPYPITGELFMVTPDGVSKA